MADKSTTLTSKPGNELGSLSVSSAEKSWEFLSQEGSKNHHLVQFYTDQDLYVSHTSTGTGSDTTRKLILAGTYWNEDIWALQGDSNSKATLYMLRVSADATVRATNITP